MSAESIDYNSLMQANLKRVFGERDASRRMKAITELYADDAVLYEPPDASAAGHAAINQAVEALLARAGIATQKPLVITSLDHHHQSEAG